VVDPAACNRRFGLIGHLSRSTAKEDRPTRQDLVDKGVNLGPPGLTRTEKATLLGDPAALIATHRKLWLHAEDALRERWFATLR
jgi:hypothetical protein